MNPNPDSNYIGSQPNNSDPVLATTPNPPQSLTAALLSDNITIRLSVSTSPYSLYNQHNRPVFGTIRFYFTPATSANPNTITDATSALAAFRKGFILSEVTSPAQGGLSTYDANGSALGNGVFWATSVNPYAYGLLESAPAGPAFLDSAAEDRLINSAAPADVSLYSPATGFTIFTPPGSTLKYAKITMTYLPPSPIGSFYGVYPALNGYFANKPGFSSYLMEGPFFKYPGFLDDPFPPGRDYTIYLQCDYDSTASNYLNIAHPVRIYTVAVSEAGTHITDVFSRPSILFANGIGA